MEQTQRFAMLLLLLLSGCANYPQPAANCDPNLASCNAARSDTEQLYIKPIPVDDLNLKYRISELKRWLKWQQAVALGQTDQPFEEQPGLIDQAPAAMTVAGASRAEHLLTIQEVSSQGRLDEAVELATELYRLQPQDLDTLTLYASLLSRQGRYQESRDLLADALQTHPQVPELYNNQAVNLAALGETGAAIELLQLAFATHPSFAMIQSNLKALYQAAAQRALAPLEQQPALALEPIEVRYVSQPPIANNTN